MALKQIVRNSSAKLEVTFYSDEAAIDADGAVTVTGTKADGSAVAGLTSPATDETGTGVYSTTVPAQSTLDLFDITFAGSFGGIPQSRRLQVEIVGGFYVALAELRAQPDLSSTTDFDTDELVVARRWFETRFENYTRRAWVPRYKRLTMSGTGTGYLSLPDVDIRTLRTVTVDDSALAASVVGALLVRGDTVRLNRNSSISINSATPYGAPFGYPDSTVVVEYEYGADSCPEDIRDAALIAIRSKLLTDNSGRPQLSIATADGIVRFATPGDGRPFGIPEVDAVANDRRRKDDGLVSMALGCG